MELYLRWLAKYEQESDENPPLGIYTLRTGKTHGVSLSLGSSFSIYNRGVANQLY